MHCELDPEIEGFVRDMQRAWAAHPPFQSLSLSEARAVGEEVRAPWREGGPTMARVWERKVLIGRDTLRIRVYDPGAERPAGMLVYLHGGGWTLFSLDTHDRLMREYAAAGAFIVIGVDYPLSPEARYPVALDLTVGLVDWLVAGGGAEVGGDARRIVLGGDSAGGNLALAAALRLRDRGSPEQIAGTLLNYGGFSGRCSDEAEARFGGPGAVLDRAEMAWYFENYYGGGVDHADDPYACPIEADLAGLPPAFLVIPECDILSEQSFVMEERMRSAGVEVQSEVYPGATHSFLEAMSVSKTARRAIADGAAWVAARFA